MGYSAQQARLAWQDNPIHAIASQAYSLVTQACASETARRAWGICGASRLLDS
jgi:hypothetical protein